MARQRPALALARRLLDGRLGLCPVLRHLWASSLATGLHDLPPAAAAVACALAARDDALFEEASRAAADAWKEPGFVLGPRGTTYRGTLADVFSTSLD